MRFFGVATRSSNRQTRRRWDQPTSPFADRISHGPTSTRRSETLPDEAPDLSR